jgi:hypothetical protein
MCFWGQLLLMAYFRQMDCQYLKVDWDWVETCMHWTAVHTYTYRNSSMLGKKKALVRDASIALGFQQNGYA